LWRQQEANSDGAFGNGSGARGRTHRTGSRVPSAKRRTARTRLHSQARRTPATGHHRTRTVIPPIGNASSCGDACQRASTGAWSPCTRRYRCASWAGTDWATNQQVTRLQPSAPATSIDQARDRRRHSLTRVSLPGNPRPASRGLLRHDDTHARTSTGMRATDDVRATRPSSSDAPSSDAYPSSRPERERGRSKPRGCAAPAARRARRRLAPTQCGRRRPVQCMSAAAGGPYPPVGVGRCPTRRLRGPAILWRGDADSAVRIADAADTRRLGVPRRKAQRATHGSPRHVRATHPRSGISEPRSGGTTAP